MLFSAGVCAQPLSAMLCMLNHAVCVAFMALPYVSKALTLLHLPRSRIAGFQGVRAPMQISREDSVSSLVRQNVFDLLCALTCRIAAYAALIWAGSGSFKT